MIYPNERQVEYWTSRAVEEYFFHQGFNIFVVPISQLLEKKMPLDHMFAGEGIKVFGFQYKRLYQQDYWKLNQAQHEKLKSPIFSWIYYALSEVRTFRENRNALHLLYITEASFTYLSRLKPALLSINTGNIRSFRWVDFYRELIGCRFGREITTIEDVYQIADQALSIEEALIDIYFVSKNGMITIHTPPIREKVRRAMRTSSRENNDA